MAAVAASPAPVRHFRSAIGRRGAYRLFGPVAAAVTALLVLASGNLGVVAPVALLATVIGVATWTLGRAWYRVRCDRLELGFPPMARAIPLTSITSVVRHGHTWVDYRSSGDFALGTDVLEIQYDANPPDGAGQAGRLPSGAPSTFLPHSRALVSPADTARFLTAIGRPPTGPSS